MRWSRKAFQTLANRDYGDVSPTSGTYINAMILKLTASWTTLVASSPATQRARLVHTVYLLFVTFSEHPHSTCRIKRATC